MIVENIFLDGFRNFHGLNVEFCNGINIICGKNAQGKTNILEAVFYFTSARSFRSASEKDLISHGCGNAYLCAGILSGGRAQKLEAKLFLNKKKELFANGVKLKKVSELLGRLTAVIFNPDDLDMIKEGAAIRRKMMDSCLSQLRPRYMSALYEFNRLYEHKTKILRGFRDKPALLDVLDDFNFRLAQQSAVLIYYRSAFAVSLSERASKIHEEFSGRSENLNINYKTVGGNDFFGKKPLDILPYLLEHQKAHREEELRAGLCLSGAHKDDLEILINSMPARKFASQGQARTAAVSIKLAERDIHFDSSGEYPVLLLDDVLSELDAQRQSFLLSRIPHGQVFISCCEDLSISGLSAGSVIYIENGRLA